MAKIGRNDLCPCGSGLKYKRCCLRTKKAASPVSPMGRLKLSLVAEIERIRQAAADRVETVRELGVFILWSNTGGAAWLLEISDGDAVQVAEAGRELEVPIDENPETISINWSHTFSIRDGRFYLCSYEDRRETCLEDAPTRRIRASLKKIRRKFSEEQLRQVHLTDSEGDPVGK